MEATEAQRSAKDTLVATRVLVRREEDEVALAEVDRLASMVGMVSTRLGCVAKGEAMAKAS